MKKLLKKMSMVLAITAASTAAAMAAEPFPQDGSPITSGDVYEVAMFQNYNATFTPSSTGVLIQNGVPELTLEGAGEPTFLGYNEFGQTFTWNVEAGVTYTITNSGFIMDSAKVMFVMENEQGITIQGQSPAEGSQLASNANGVGYILIQFNTAVVYDTAYLVAGDTNASLSTLPSSDNSLAFDIAKSMKTMYLNGTLNEGGGDPISLTINGLKSKSGVLYNGDGQLTINYVSAPKLADMISNNVPATFKSFYPAGDAEALLKFEFDRDLMNDGSIILAIGCGNVESEGTYYYEEIVCDIDGNTAKADLSGKLRDLNDYVMYQGNDYVGLKLINVRDINGLQASGDGQGNVGSYPFTATYKYIQPANVVSEFTPASGTSLQGVDNIEIWFNNSNLINYDGVEFTYAVGDDFNTVVVDKADLSIVTENNETTINVAVPEEVKGKDQITVGLYNVTSLDGHDHNIVAEYDKFVVTLISPIQPGQSIESTGDDDFIFSINRTDLYHYVRYDFYNGEGETGWVYGTRLYQQDNGTWTSYNGNYTCYTNFEPYMVVSAYQTENEFNMGYEPMETYTFRFKGTTKPFENSIVKFVGIDPEPNSTITPADDFCWTITFDGLVNIDAAKSGIPLGMGAGIKPFSKLEPVYSGNEDTEGYADVWKLYPDVNYLRSLSSVTISLVANDVEGMLVEGNTGLDETATLQFDYLIYVADNFKALNVAPAAGSTVEEISSFVISCNGLAVGPNFSYSGEEKAVIYGKDHNVEYTFTEADCQIISDIIGYDELNNPIYDEITQVVLSVNPAIIEDGAYTLFIPEGYFLLGDMFNTSYNAEFTGTYNIGTGEPGEEGVQLTVNPAAGDVAALTRIDITAPGIDEAGCFGTDNVTITDENGMTVFSITSGELYDNSFDMNSWSFIGYYIEPNITTPGTYTLTIPAGMFEFIDMSKSAALTAVYNIKADGIAQVVVETADEYVVYAVNGTLVMKTASAADLLTLRKGIYIINGKKTLIK